MVRTDGSHQRAFIMTSYDNMFELGLSCSDRAHSAHMHIRNKPLHINVIRQTLSAVCH